MTPLLQLFLQFNPIARRKGILFCLQQAKKYPRYVWQIFVTMPRIVLWRFGLRKPIIFLSRLYGIGDIVCTLPSVATLKKMHPEAAIVYETSHKSAPLVKRFEDVDLVVEEGSLVARLLKNEFKLEYSLFPLLPDEKKPPQHRARVHLSEEFRKCLGLETLIIPQVHLKPRRSALRELRRRLQRELISDKSLIVIHTGPTWKVKEWPIKNWTELVWMLKSRNNLEVIQIGENSVLRGELREISPVAGAHSWIGTLTMDQILALLSLAALVVGVDSGILHLAGAVGAPCVGIFGPTDPICFLPRSRNVLGVTASVECLGCHHHSQGPLHWLDGCRNNIQCMSELSPSAVLNACEAAFSLSHIGQFAHNS